MSISLHLCEVFHIKHLNTQNLNITNLFGMIMNLIPLIQRCQTITLKGECVEVVWDYIGIILLTAVVLFTILVILSYVSRNKKI